MRSNHSTWDPRRPVYEELQPPPIPRRQGSNECYHPAGIFIIFFFGFFVFYGFWF